jgi:hypothetical protein
VSWRVVSAAQIGTSHIESGKNCEDSCWAQVEAAPDGSPLLTIFVADGAGSAAQGGEGAELAIQTAAAFMAQKAAQGTLTLTSELATECVNEVRQRIQVAADAVALTPRDFACTFLGVLASPSETLVLQVGDGGIVVNVGNGLELPVIPMAGEYANMTHFVTDESALDVLATRVYSAAASQVAVFSDGLQRLALNMATNTPHEPFFARFFQVLAAATDAQEEEVHAALLRFLESSAVNERTDDDKTLALAVLKS